MAKKNCEESAAVEVAESNWPAFPYEYADPRDMILGEFNAGASLEDGVSGRLGIDTIYENREAGGHAVERRGRFAD